MCQQRSLSLRSLCPKPKRQVAFAPPLCLLRGEWDELLPTARTLQAKKLHALCAEDGKRKALKRFCQDSQCCKKEKDNEEADRERERERQGAKKRAPNLALLFETSSPRLRQLSPKRHEPARSFMEWAIQPEVSSLFRPAVHPAGFKVSYLWSKVVRPNPEAHVVSQWHLCLFDRLGDVSLTFKGCSVRDVPHLLQTWKRESLPPLLSSELSLE